MNNHIVTEFVKWLRDRKIYLSRWEEGGYDGEQLVTLDTYEEAEHIDAFLTYKGNT